MALLPLDIVCLTAADQPDTPSAADWCRGRCRSTATQTAEAVGDGLVDLSAADLVWWHAETPEKAVIDTAAARCGEPLRAYVEAGGALLLTGAALAAVEPLGIDPVGPDHVGHEFIDDASGLTPKSIQFDHPAFEGFSDRIRTLPPGEYPTVSYESMLPARGQVLASAIRGDHRLVASNTMVSWQMGDGVVYGVGSAVSFADHVAGEYAARRDQLLQNLIMTLGGDRRPTFTDRPTTPAGQQRLRERLSGDHHRPGYHLAAPAGWLNDPNGLIQVDGTFHLFYQYNPGGPFHGSIHWGHATSEDLLSWTDQPVALAPDHDGPDRDGCWSGCAVEADNGAVKILYTGGCDRDQLPCLATAADDGLNTWQKDPRNPIIDEVPAKPAILETDDWAAEFRDHCVWKHDGVWYQLIGAGLEAGGGVVLLYRGESLDNWTYVGPLLSGDHERPYTVWECPELLDFGEKQLLHISNYETVTYYIGTADLDAPNFDVAHEGQIDHGCFYAPQTMETDDGRLLMWGWLKPGRTEDAQWDAGWSGCFSLPRELSLDSDGRLRQEPARELTELRGRHVGIDERFDDGAFRTLDLETNCYELALSVACEPGATFELGVFESPARSERTVIRYDGESVVLDRSAASHDQRVEAGDYRLSVSGNGLDLRVFIDGSVLELFINGRECLSSRIYPTRQDADGVSVSAVGGVVDVNLDAWELAPTFPAGRRRQEE